MAPQKQVKLAFGGGAFGRRPYMDRETTTGLLDILAKHHVPIIDTAQAYGFDIGPGASERLLGEANAGERFIIDTKAKMGLARDPKQAEAEGLEKGADDSMERLQVKQVDIFYLHAPEPAVPIESTLKGVDAAYKKGYFKRFGLSNYKPEDVQAVYDHCKAQGYVLPSAYQGNYNAVARKVEETLLPLLRKLGIAFYAYSPIAGGFLSKSREQVAEAKGRWDPESFIGKMYRSLYAEKPELLNVLDDWGEIANAENCTRSEVAYRWTRYHSALDEAYDDALIFGGSNNEQIEQTLVSLEKGPLKDESVARIEAIWEKIKHVAPLDNING